MKLTHKVLPGYLNRIIAWIQLSALFLNAGLVYAGGSEEKKPEDYWRETPLSFDLLKSFLKQENCYATQEKFIGCVQALNTLGAYAQPSVALATADMVQSDRKTFGKAVQAF